MLDTLKRDYPLTESQLLFWRGHQLQPDVPLYNMAWRFDLYGPIDPDRFGRSLSEVIAASDALRAVFRIVDGLPRQYVSEAPFDWAGEIDLSGEINPEDALRRLAATITSQPFDLFLGSFRTQLIKMSESHWVWLCCQHHIICDAQSGAVLFKAMSDRYQGLVNDLFC